VKNEITSCLKYLSNLDVLTLLC